MRWTIGMPSYNNPDEVYFTIQSLRLHHDLSDCEIVVIDNYGSDVIERFCREKGAGLVRYDRYTEKRGVSPAKNRIFEIARGEFVMCMDSHVLIKAGALDITPPGDDLVQGPCLFNDWSGYSCEWVPKWINYMWGTWTNKIDHLPEKPFEIWAIGAGFFCCRRDSWLGFNRNFRGFGGETGYIQEKYRRAGRKVWCDPTKIWVHYFCNVGKKTRFFISLSERARNYIIGFEELGMNTSEMEKHFGPQIMAEARDMLARETAVADSVDITDEEKRVEIARIDPQEVR